MNLYDHHAAIYYLLLDKLRHQLVGNDTQTANREVQRRRPSSIAEQAMRKINRASTSEDCRRLVQHSTTTPTASNSKISVNTRTCDSPPSHGIDAAKLLAATNSEDALKILQQANTSNFSISTEASKLMSTLQMSAVPPFNSTMEIPPFRDYLNHMHTYSYLHNTMCQPTLETESKGSLSKFSLRLVNVKNVRRKYATNYSKKRGIIKKRTSFIKIFVKFGYIYVIRKNKRNSLILALPRYFFT